ncbi:uncharacterized protein BDR25DRAFT_246763 [Lindgomyces ingoldianus]|uniref:Uncharacterized protein n=1 Tax=Lindgomyces ingoldianus TaxID=673940 RepID=A0ACB6Q7Y0_9PLEO|nr:uncharacterized protein BDR25DRAFT_246763 [Lindgomyces ingoldianus]KAF2462994.1 hypothetical protein BDR25DRAFT_246763 [Lindgomyces ingoldianus]
MSGFGGHSTAPRGLFENGTWRSTGDCNPRNPAVHFQVKKAGANTGRWFYTCQKHKDDPTNCRFFLWDDDAKPREERALLNNSRTEPGRTAQDTPAQTQRLPEPPPPYTAEVGPSETPRKRTRTFIEGDHDENEDEFAFDQGDVALTNELEQVARDVETPRKAVRIDANTVPGRRKLPWTRAEPADGMPTPQSEPRVSKDLFPTRFSAPGSSFLTPSKYEGPDNGHSSRRTPASSPFDTPTPTRHRDAGLDSSDDDLVRDVFGLLREEDVALDEQAEKSLSSLLSKSVLRTQGIIKGREYTRLTLKAKDAKITELQHRVTTLEAELEAEKALVKHLRWQAETGHLSDS